MIDLSTIAYTWPDRDLSGFPGLPQLSGLTWKKRIRVVSNFGEDTPVSVVEYRTHAESGVISPIKHTGPDNYRDVMVDVTFDETIISVSLADVLAVAGFLAAGVEELVGVFSVSSQELPRILPSMVPHYDRFFTHQDGDVDRVPGVPALTGKAAHAIIDTLTKLGSIPVPAAALLITLDFAERVKAS